jgi:PAS domain S-box-containing protein
LIPKLIRSMSLKTRIVVLVVVLLIAGIWGLAARVSAAMQADLQRLLSDQLLATVGYVAADLDSNIKLRFDVLNEITASITPDLLTDPRRLQTSLKQRHGSVALFRSGVFAVNAQGVIVADYPGVPGRLGGFVGDRGYFQAVMAGGKQIVSSPRLGRFSKVPLVSLAVPLHDAAGKPAGALIGTIYPSDPSLFGAMEATKLGKTGYFLVASPKDRIFVSATDKNRILQQVPQPGANPLFDRRIAGFEGPGVVVNARGFEVLTANRDMKTTGWIVIAAIPTEEAFAPIATLKRQIYLAALLISLLVALALRVVLVRQLAPLAAAATAMRRMSEGKEKFAPLPVVRDDEIGALVGNFNRLMSERDRLEQVLRATHERFRDLVALSSDWYWEQDANLRFTRMSEEILPRGGLRPESTLGKLRWELPIVGVSEDEWNLHRALLERREPFSDFVYQMVNEAGERRWYSISGKPLFGATGEFIGYRGTGRDITERKRAEEVRAHLAAIIENSSDAIISRRLDGTILSWNAAAERLLGYSAAEAIGKSIAIIMPPGDLEAQLTPASLLLGGGRIPPTEIVRRTKDGRLIDVLRSVSPVRSESGEIIAAAVIMHDITRRKAAEAELTRLNAELEQRVAERTAELEHANRELEAFTYSVSHDLRSPLRALSGFSEIVLAENADKLDPDAVRHLQRVRDAGKRMGALIDDLLALSRVSRLQVKRRVFDFSAMAAEVGASLAQANPERSVRLSVRPGMVLDADPGLMRIVLENLIGNAVKFSAQVSDALIEVGSEERDGDTVFFVRDNGAGFDMAYAAQLFKPFKRLHGETEFEGTGIGLSIVQRALTRHGGRVWGVGQTGRGATFYFTTKPSARARRPSGGCDER